ncbi:hypothetical protein [Pseudomonas matsuisoli]|uniref:Transmembrane protein n=1 Tax=Pseudomonas matsuisoli TaxID=1515666 RepID=A0A917Q159_9PSED|nr:hypothetical protein [Pseudomonas matsuisoli]GGK05104.1 hypothetical protein GCM10009304_34050 [Pseudomonas matsuisoli]
MTLATRHLLYSMFFTLLYVAIHLLAIVGVFDAIIGHAAGWFLAIAAALPVAGWLWVTLRIMDSSDEYLRALMGRRLLLAVGLTMTVLSVWGFGESYANAPHLPVFLACPLLFLAFAVVSPFVRQTRA